jgi:hypothetical protein
MYRKVVVNTMGTDLRFNDDALAMFATLGTLIRNGKSLHYAYIGPERLYVEYEDPTELIAYIDADARARLERKQAEQAEREYRTQMWRYRDEEDAPHDYAYDTNPNGRCEDAPCCGCCN